MALPHGRPHGLVSDWYDYKRGTKAITNFLISEGRKHFSELQMSNFISVATMKMLATRIHEKRLEFSEDMAYTFRNTIAKRAHVSEYFVKQLEGGQKSEKTVGHESFAACLQWIYDLLRVNELKTKKNYTTLPKVYHHPTVSTEAEDIMEAYETASAVFSDCSEAPEDKVETQRFSNSVEDTSTADFSPIASSNATSPVVRTSKKFTKSSKHLRDRIKELGVRIEGDEMFDLFGITLFFQRINQCCSSVVAVWEEAAREEIPFTAAAFMTDFIWHDFIESDWLALLPQDLGHPGDLFLLYVKLMQSTGCNFSDFQQESVRRFDSGTIPGEILAIPFASLPMDYTQVPFGPVQKPADYIPPHPHERFDRGCVMMLLNSLSKLRLRTEPAKIDQDDKPSYAFERFVFYNSVCPLYDRMMSLLHFPEKERKLVEIQCHLGVSFGLRLLLESSRAYLWSAYRDTISNNEAALVIFPAVENCRFRLIRLANAMHKITRDMCDHPVMACHCGRGQQRGLAQFAKFLDLVRTDVRFDLYFQSPWVAGAQILDLAFQAARLGIQLMSYEGVVGGTLHVYNVLRRHELIKPFALLDQLGEIFCDSIFMGSKPMRNYESCFLRFKGGRAKPVASVNGNLNTKGRRLRRFDREEFEPEEWFARTKRNFDRVNKSRHSFWYTVMSANYDLDPSSTRAEVFGFPVERLPLTDEKLEKWKTASPEKLELNDMVQKTLLKDF